MAAVLIIWQTVWTLLERRMHMVHATLPLSLLMLHLCVRAGSGQLWRTALPGGGCDDAGGGGGRRGARKRTSLLTECAAAHWHLAAFTGAQHSTAEL